jgi:hypothetical protein
MRVPRRSEFDFAAFPVFPTEVVAMPRKPTHYQWGSPANSDSYAGFAIGFRMQEGLAALPASVRRQPAGLARFPAGRDGIG